MLLLKVPFIWISSTFMKSGWNYIRRNWFLLLFFTSVNLSGSKKVKWKSVCKMLYYVFKFQVHVSIVRLENKVRPY